MKMSTIAIYAALALVLVASVSCLPMGASQDQEENGGKAALQSLREDITNPVSTATFGPNSRILATSCFESVVVFADVCLCRR